MTAIFSECGQYRYQLTRPAESLFSEGPPAVFVMLNPSTATADKDDATISQCRRFALKWGANGLVVANLYAWRATDPSKLTQVPDPVGPDNDHTLRKLAAEYRDIVCAWGNNGVQSRVEEVVSLLTAQGARLWCVGTTKSGAPKHPLYVRADQPLIPWHPQRA